MSKSKDKLLILAPPLSPHLLTTCEACLRTHLRLEEDQSLDPASTALILYPNVAMAKRHYSAVLLPPEVFDLAVVFFAGSLTGSIEANGHFSIVGFLEGPFSVTGSPS
jgi:hypothetical protein